jgi:hypothetical protein
VPPLTSLVVRALIASGEGDSLAVTNGVAYLLRTQNSDGSWADGGWVVPVMPPISYYSVAASTWTWPLEALASYADHLGHLVTRDNDAIAGEAPSRDARLPNGAWNPAYLATMRAVADPVADAVISDIEQAGDRRHQGGQCLAREDHAKR